MTDYRALADQAEARISRSTPADLPRDDRRDVARPPGPSPLVALPRLLNRGDATAQFFLEVERNFQPVAHTRLLGQHLYVLTSPEAIVEVFLTQGRHTMKGRGLQAAKALLGNGLLTSEGEEHLRQRRLVQPAFHRDRIEAYAHDMVRRSVARADSWRVGDRFDVIAEMSALTLEIVGDTLFGLDLTGDATEVGEALSGVLEGAGGRLILGPLAMRVPTPGRREALASTARLDAVVKRLIEQHRQSGGDSTILSMLVDAQEDGVGMSDEQVRDEVMTLMLAGHETTAMSLSWTWLLLAQNPAMQQWWREELDGALEGREPGFDDFAALPRTRAIVAESLRLFPPAWIMGRRLLDDLVVGEWTLPRGTIAVGSQFAVHRSERWWVNPMSFVPTRWITPEGEFDESAPGQPRGAWFGFGFGNRRCIGEQFAWMEAVLALASIGQRWRLERESLEPIGLRPNVTLRPRGETTMRVAAL